MKVCLRVSLLTIATFFCFSDAVAAQNDAVRGNALALPQGWSADTIDQWYLISQGTTLIPHEWFLALEQLRSKGANPLTRKSAEARFSQRACRPEQSGRPSRRALQMGGELRLRQPRVLEGQLAWIGLRRVSHRPSQLPPHEIRIEGDLPVSTLRILSDNSNSLSGKFAQDPQALASFVERVRAPAADVQKGLACFAKVLAAEKEFYSNKDLGTPAGYGRLDVHG